MLAWVQTAYPAAWQSLQKNHGSNAGEVLLDRLRHQLDQQGTLEVLRGGIEMVGVKGRIRFAEFKPAFNINPDIVARYQANRLRVVRQVRYSLANENCIDLVLFLNGIPVATVELKTDFTQSIDDAIDQYRYDRHPKPKGSAPEPLLSFPGGALVHFAVSNSEVHMTTRLEGKATTFLPFNKGDNGGKGNPIDPVSGHRTAYLWKEVWEREGWLEILGRYLVVQRDSKKVIERVIFPRYHQLDATRKLQAAVLADGVGGRYLIQHSAGSGKTNSIAWTAHFLSELHDAQDKKLFDTVIVVSDRNVIDAQLQEALFGFQKQMGVVATIKNEESSKSAALAEALSGEQEDRCLHHPDVPVRPGEGARARRHRGQAVRGDRGRGPQLADRGGGVQAEGGAVAGGAGEPQGRRRGQRGGYSRGPDVRPGGRQGHHVRRLHGDAEEQDARTVRHSTGSDSEARARQRAEAVPRLLDAAGHRGRASSWTCCGTTRPTSSPSSSPTTARTTPSRRSSAPRP